MERPLCACHGVPQYPSGRHTSWQCAVTHRERVKARYAGLTDEKREQRRKQQLEHWHRVDGGYIRRRRRHLAEQRTGVLERLELLEQEASLVPQP